MIVVSKVNNGRLVKGAKYEVWEIFNSKSSKQQHSQTISIKLNDDSSPLRYYFIDYFELEDGKPIPNIDWQSDELKKDIYEKTNTWIDINSKAGDLVVCCSNEYKNLIIGEKYKIIDIKNTTKGSWRSDTIKIKLDGSNTYYSSYNFRKCTLEENRQISLKLLTDKNSIEELIKKNNTKQRKFDLLTTAEKNKLLYRVLFDAALDTFRNNLSILDWAIQKIGKKYFLVKDDFNEIIEDGSVMKVLENI
jgi:hypothetical protein